MGTLIYAYLYKNMVLNDFINEESEGWVQENITDFYLKLVLKKIQVISIYIYWDFWDKSISRIIQGII